MEPDRLRVEIREGDRTAQDRVCGAKARHRDRKGRQDHAAHRRAPCGDDAPWSARRSKDRSSEAQDDDRPAPGRAPQHHQDADHQATGDLGVARHMSATKTKKRWVASVKTDATHPPPGLFTKDAATIARTLASKRVSPKGPASGMRMLTYFVNRAGRGLTPTRRAELARAKRLLSERVRSARERRQRQSARM